MKHGDLIYNDQLKKNPRWKHNRKVGKTLCFGSIYTFRVYWQFQKTFEEVQNGSVQERVLACIARCEIELGLMPNHGKR